MPEGRTRTPTYVTLNYKEHTKTTVDGYLIYTIYISGANFLELPMDANVRLPTTKSVPYKEMVTTLKYDQPDFFLQNSGISIIASKVEFNHARNQVKLEFRPGTGIVNGGHTQLAVLDVKEGTDVTDVTVKLEIIAHDFSAQELAEIAASRNTASNVKPYSTAEKKGFFKKIKTEMDDEFEKHIIWYENREVPNNKGLSAVDLIARLNLFNVIKHQSHFNHSSTDQPNKSATGKSSVFKDWENNQEQFVHTYPLVDDIIRLEEHILATFNVGIPRGFTSLKVIRKYDIPKKTIFSGKDIKFELPKQFLMPILASFRALLKYDEEGQTIGWYRKPEKVFDDCKHQIFETVLKTFKSTYQNVINRASKDSNLWQILYMIVAQTVKRNGTHRQYNIPR